MTQHVNEEDVATTGDEDVSPAQDPPERPAPNPRLAGAVVAGFTALAVGVSVLGGDLLNPAASTADGDYAGETVEMMIPLAEGGGTDTWARFVGAELTEAVPGSPGLAPVNDDGGEGILGTNHFMTSAKPDGTEVLVSTASTVVPYLLDLPAVQYDFNELRPILANGTGAVVYARTGAGVRGIEDLDRPGQATGLRWHRGDQPRPHDDAGLRPALRRRRRDLRVRGPRPGQPRPAARRGGHRLPDNLVLRAGGRAAGEGRHRGAALLARPGGRGR